MTNQEALTILEKSEKCHTEDCPDDVFCDECPWNVKTAEYDEALRAIRDALSKQSASAQTEQNAYEQGQITGRVEMRTEILGALKDIVGSEVWNNV